MTQLLSNVDNDARFHNASCAPAALDPRTEAVWNTGIPNFVGESLDACFRMSRPFPVVHATPSSDHSHFAHLRSVRLPIASLLCYLSSGILALASHPEKPTKYIKSPASALLLAYCCPHKNQCDRPDRHPRPTSAPSSNRFPAVLQTLRLSRLSWSKASDIDSLLNYFPASSARPMELSICAEHAWLLDPCSAYLVTWLARSGTADALQAIRFQWMAILEGRLLAAVAEVIEASSGALRDMLIRVGPGISLQSLRDAFRRCFLLEQLNVHIPHQTPSIHDFTTFVQHLDLPQLRRLNIRLEMYSKCTNITHEQWDKLDLALKTLDCPRLDCVSVLRHMLNLRTNAIGWGDIHEAVPYDPVSWRTELAQLLPLTHARHILHYCDNVYGLPSRVPLRVHLSVPIEVCERVIDLVASGRSGSLGHLWAKGAVQTLQACSLTCRAWRIRAQAHLFRIVRVRCTFGQPYNIADFADLLRRHPALRDFVHTCIVEPTPHVSAPPTLHTVALHLPQTLRQLEHLRVSFGVLYPTPGFEVCMRRFTTITKLSLLDVVFHSLKDLQRTIAGCNNLKTLHVLWCGWHGKGPAVPPTTFPRTAVRLRDLVVAANPQSTADSRTLGFLRWLARSGVMEAATGVFFHLLVILDSSLLDAVDDLLVTSRRTLTDLYLAFAPGVDFSSLNKTLGSCPKLGLVSLRIPYTTDAFATLVSLLSKDRLSVSKRPQLHLWLRFHEFPGAIRPASADWAALDDALQLPFHDSLRGLTVGLWPLKVPAGDAVAWGENYGYAVSEADPAIGEEIKAMLPQTMKRKKLRLLWDRLV